jgi:hypothetical protein
MTLPLPHWSTLRITDRDARGRSLDGAPRLAALYRWYMGDSSIAVSGPHGPRTDPRAIDWTEFPAHEVLAAQLAPAEAPAVYEDAPAVYEDAPAVPEDAPAEQAPPVRRRNVLRSRSTIGREGEAD